MLVKATREGLTGARTATGWRISDQVPYVALPSRAALYQLVQVYNPLVLDEASGTFLAVQAIVLDVGPHFTDDEAYVFGGSRPRAESAQDLRGNPLNGAGIDLGECIWRALQMKDNTEVGWSFVARLEAAPPQGAIAPDPT